MLWQAKRKLKLSQMKKDAQALATKEAAPAFANNKDAQDLPNKKGRSSSCEIKRKLQLLQQKGSLSSRKQKEAQALATKEGAPLGAIWIKVGNDAAAPPMGAPT